MFINSEFWDKFTRNQLDWSELRLAYHKIRIPRTKQRHGKSSFEKHRFEANEWMKVVDHCGTAGWTKTIYSAFVFQHNIVNGLHLRSRTNGIEHLQSFKFVSVTANIERQLCPIGCAYLNARQQYKPFKIIQYIGKLKGRSPIPDLSRCVFWYIQLRSANRCANLQIIFVYFIKKCSNQIACFCISKSSFKIIYVFAKRLCMRKIGSHWSLLD